MNFDVIENLSSEDLLKLYEDIVVQEEGIAANGYYCLCKSSKNGENISKCYHGAETRYMGGNCCVDYGWTNDKQGCRDWCLTNCGGGTFVGFGEWICNWASCRY